MKKFTFVLTLLLCLPLIVQAQIKLNYNINPGSSYITKVVLEQDISQTVMGQTQDIESDQGYGIQLKFTDLEDGKYSVTMVYNSIMVNQPMAGLDYDS
ncbi:MAG TPA: hypothetical protein DHV30_17855, partial [Balneola sp.]|nr:hypothetical protein [Balneola sp.]